MTDYHTVMRTEVECDIYEDDRRQMFHTYCDGDMDSDKHTEDIVLTVNELPPGAVIRVEYPCCPDCGDPRQPIYESLEGGRLKVVGHESTCECGFNWIEWEDGQYS